MAFTRYRAKKHLPLEASACSPCWPMMKLVKIPAAFKAIRPIPSVKETYPTRRRYPRNYVITSAFNSPLMRENTIIM